MLKNLAVMCLALSTFVGCFNPPTPPQSASGVKQASTHVTVGSDGLTIEQHNIKERLAMDNKPGSIKHLYLLSPFNGRQIFYSTVKGKITSSGKRLTPKAINGSYNPESYVSNNGTPLHLADRWVTTPEVIQDDGTYGDSSEYLYFWNENNQYFQLYVGGLTVVVSDQPASFQDVVIRNERE